MMNMCTLMAFHAAPAALKTKETERVSAKDPELQAVRRCLVEERWNGAPKQYLPMHNELTFMVMWFWEEQELWCLKLYERESSAWHTKGTKELSRQRRDSGRKPGDRRWIGMWKSCVRSVMGANLWPNIFHSHTWNLLLCLSTHGKICLWIYHRRLRHSMCQMNILIFTWTKYDQSSKLPWTQKALFCHILTFGLRYL